MIPQPQFFSETQMLQLRYQGKVILKHTLDGRSDHMSQKHKDIPKDKRLKKGTTLHQSFADKRVKDEIKSGQLYVVVATVC